MNQPDLFPVPKATCEELHALLAILNYSGWRTAAEIQISARANWNMLWSDRKIRAIANASDGQVISGQLGYKLTLQATTEEIHHASAWLRHQSEEMAHRALQIDLHYQRHAKPVSP